MIVSNMNSHNEAELKKFLEMKFKDLKPGEHVGLRFLLADYIKNSEKNTRLPSISLHGIYNDAVAAERDMVLYSANYNVYASLNPINFTDKCTLNKASASIYTFCDTDVARLMSLLIDFDPERKDGASTYSELELAYTVCNQVENLLKEKGITYALFCSGNGYHIIVKLPSYHPNRSSEINCFLQYMKSIYATEQVNIDTSVSNPSRIARAYGTLNKKGFHSEERPYRMACSISGYGDLQEYDVLKIFSAELAAFKNKAVSPIPINTFINNLNILQNDSSKKYSNFKGDITSLDMVGLFKEAGLYIKHHKDNKHIGLCPNRHEHSSNTDGASATIIFQNGFGQSNGFKCQHSHCSDINLSTLLNRYFPPEMVDRHCVNKFVNLQKSDALSFVKQSDSYNLTKVYDLVNEPKPEYEYIVDQLLLIGAFSLLAAKPKVGKTTLLRSLAVAVATGKDWLGYKTKKETVLYLALEEHRSEMRKQFQKLGVDENTDLYIHAAAAPSQAVEKLEQLIQQHHPGLVIIDTMHKLTKFEDGNNYAQVNMALEPLTNLCREYKCHILCTHHLSKDDTREPEDAILGSTAISGAFDILIFLTKENDNRKMKITFRYDTDEPFKPSYLVLDSESRQLSLNSIEEIKNNHLEKNILNFLRDVTVGQSSEAIADAISKRISDVTKTLKELTASGKILMQGRGIKGDPKIYSHPDNVFPPLEKGNGNSIIPLSFPKFPTPEGNTYEQ